MAVKGSILKEEITQKILNTFPNSFLYNNGKEIRIPGLENSELLQIKVTLTCAKTNVDVGGDVAIPGVVSTPVASTPTPAAKAPIEPTAEEKQNVASLLEMLGL